MGESTGDARRLAKSIGPAIVGTTLGALITASSVARGEPRWVIWTALAVSLTGAAGAVFTHGLGQWEQLPTEERPPRSTMRFLTAVALGGGIVTLIGAAGIGHHVRWRGIALVSICLVGSIPAAATCFAIGRAARSPEWQGSRNHGAQAAWLIERRRTLRSLLSAAGSLVALFLLALGAAGQLDKDLLAAGKLDRADVITPEYTLVCGGFGSLTVACVYAPAAIALTRRARQLCLEVIDISRSPDASTLLSDIENRRRLETLLGADAGPFTDLQAGLVVLAPLIASAASLLLPH
jgi:hypothetical protein